MLAARKGRTADDTRRDGSAKSNRHERTLARIGVAAEPLSESRNGERRRSRCRLTLLLTA
ncbi:hypothetical protein C0Z20_06580 [Trinickia symbiotica]|uniref:Uncharacterized protein n=1 Tax=Trinickia symbiotica TaxID=863227 RepID=A0A2N7X780_9BURK|nr:hypothetical protein C0Z20_06580 [Trinickia symbiotica]